MKECTHCGGPNAPENRVCDYCGMGFSADTIPEGSVDPRDTAKLENEALKEALKEAKLFEFNLDSPENQNVTINTPFGQKIVINDPVEKASSLMGSLLTGAAGAAGSAINNSMNSSRRPPRPPRPQHNVRISTGCGGVLLLAFALSVMLPGLVVLLMNWFAVL